MRLNLTKQDIDTIMTALNWYHDDRIVCASIVADGDYHTAAADATVTLREKIERQIRRAGGVA